MALHRRKNLLFGLLFGGALLAAGVALWAKGSLLLPTRRPPAHLKLEGLTLFLFGLSPVLAGLVLLRSTFGPRAIDPTSPRDPMTLTFLAACAAMISALLLSQRV